MFGLMRYKVGVGCGAGVLWDCCGWRLESKRDDRDKCLCKDAY